MGDVPRRGGVPRRGPGFCVAVKANAYGHGAARLAGIAFEEGAEAVGVATVEEGALLRDAGIEGRILLYSIATAQESPLIVELGLEPFVADKEWIEALANASGRRPDGAESEKPLACHLKVDTGMGRIGCRPEDAGELASLIAGAPGLSLAALCTHFPAADVEDQSFTREQLARLDEALSGISRQGVHVPAVHAANSGATLALPESYRNMVRPGIATYGYFPSHDQRRTLELKPVMEFESRVAFVKKVYPGETVSYGRTWCAGRETVIATIPAGYADGYNRLLSNRGEVLLFERTGRARRVPVAGRVCMDQFMVDCGPDSHVAVGDRVVLFGPDRRGPDAEELADAIGTIPYEVLSQVNARVPRLYL